MEEKEQKSSNFKTVQVPNTYKLVYEEKKN